MRVTEIQRDDVASNCRLETNAVDLKLLAETVTHSLDHVVDEGAAQSMQRLGLRVFALAGNENVRSIHFHSSEGGQFPSQLALGTFDVDALALDLDLDLGRDDDGLFSNA